MEQIVIYIGRRVAKLIKGNKLKLRGLTHEFSVVDLLSVRKDVFLQSKKPECVMLAILANFGHEKPEAVVRQILTNVSELCTSKNNLVKYQEQLLVLSRLRDLTETTIKLINDMDFHFEVEKDVLFIKGIEKGEVLGMEKGMEKGVDIGVQKAISVMKMLLKGGYSLQEIIKATDTDKAFVDKVAKEFGLKIPQ